MYCKAVQASPLVHLSAQFGPLLACGNPELVCKRRFNARIDHRKDVRSDLIGVRAHFALEHIGPSLKATKICNGIFAFQCQ